MAYRATIDHPDAETSKLPREPEPSVDDHDRVVGDELALAHDGAVDAMR